MRRNSLPLNALVKWPTPNGGTTKNARAPGKWQSGERQAGLNDVVADKSSMDLALRNG